MKDSPMHEPIRPAEFEGLEARLLLDAAPTIQPDGPMPQTAGTDCGPIAEVSVEADPTCGTPGAGGETTEFTNEYHPDSRDIDTPSALAGDVGPPVLPLVQEPGEASRERTDWLGWFPEGAPEGVVIAYEPVWSIGTGQAATAEEAEASGPYVVDLLSTEVGEEGQPIVVLLYVASPEPDGAPVGASELSDPDWIPMYDGFAGGETQGDDGPDLYKYMEIDGSEGAAGHCKIMAVRVANPEGAPGGADVLGGADAAVFTDTITGFM